MINSQNQQNKKNENVVTYNERCAITKEFIHWCYKTNALTSLENFFAFLDINGMINPHKCKSYLFKKKSKNNN